MNIIHTEDGVFIDILISGITERRRCYIDQDLPHTYIPELRNNEEILYKIDGSIEIIKI